MGKLRVLVAMSGGLDSSLSAILLKEQGYEVVGLTMKTWDYLSTGPKNGKETGCCSLEAIHEARRIAVEWDFPHYVLDIRPEFGTEVIDYFTEAYLSGETPNPCVMCNTHIKWKALWKRAQALNCKQLATGHYARIRREEHRYVISRAHDRKKDQSYALWGVKQDYLKHTLFPVGGFSKDEVRKMASLRGMDRLVEKAESYEICFIPDNDYRRFLRDRVPEKVEKIGEGDFVLSDGTYVGKHKGYPFYTIGQRRGLDVALGYPVYVLEIDPTHNRVVLGRATELRKTCMRVGGLNMIKYDQLPTRRMEALTQIRYNHRGEISWIHQKDDKIETVFHHPVEAITPGQAAVFYEGDDVLGGGWIEREVDSSSL
ncbi:MAG: tRNA 2-thiouridine(34) synthase MnmA [Cytophagales bacterium]|nr:tRNA 2-thiouridine(34) synthase MnmA [Cytophagales bacterium]